MKPKIDIQVRDILQSGADIVVFSAHPSLLAGSGVSGVVHKAAGPELEIVLKCQKLTNSLNGYED